MQLGSDRDSEGGRSGRVVGLAQVDAAARGLPAHAAGA